MKVALILSATALILGAGCAHKRVAHKQNLFIFRGVKDGQCDVDQKLSHWDAKTGAMILVCK